MNETKVRIDYVHHALSATYQWILGAREDENLDDALHEPLILRHQYFRRARALRDRQAEAAAGTVVEAEPEEGTVLDEDSNLDVSTDQQEEGTE